MTFLVAYDGSDLARAALRRADELATGLDVPLVTVTVVPVRADWARDRGWLADSAPFDRGTVADSVEAEVTAVAPTATVDVRFVDERAPSGTIANELRRAAVDREADVVVLGSDDAGSLVRPISSVGSSVASDDRYDVFIVRSDDR